MPSKFAIRLLLPAEALSWAFALAFAAVVAVGQDARCDDEADLLAVARDRHRAAREGIRTLSADVVVEITFPQKKLFQSGQYWRSFGTVRVRESSPGTDNIEDHLLKDGEIRGVGRRRLPDGRYDRHGAGRNPGADQLCLCDAWRDMLIEFFDSTVRRYDYDRFLALAKRPPTARRETADGRDCVRVSLTVPAEGGDWNYTLWHDIERNYLIRKITVTIGGGETTFEYEILEFREPAPGVVVPVSRRLRSVGHGKLEQEEVTTLSNVRVNEPIAAAVFTLPPVPAGTVLHDWVEGTRYPIDPNWKPIGPKVPTQVLPIGSRSDDSPSEYRAQTVEEPRPLSRWLAPGSAAVLGVAAGVWVYRRRRGRRQPVGA